ncbi:MAG: 50S ribosomal protein L16 [Candidatus Riflebacteria bacterium]|jgi:large subunit ribosomal protein L16|nr:50S ribosomal protein L16 [Candidatus Riflebacteria bacterium]MBQ3644318.1 50S ribosomal protein L16 [Candidatus Riflebacteria bacterium]
MLMPARTKFRKQHRGRMTGMAKGGKYLAFGSFGLQALDCHWLTSNQIEAARKVITRTVKRTGKMWIRIFPDKPVSKKPLETRMGKGKGAPEFWVAVIKPGKILFELEGVPENVAIESLTQAANKLPIRCQVVSNNN